MLRSKIVERDMALTSVLHPLSFYSSLHPRHNVFPWSKQKKSKEKFWYNQTRVRTKAKQNKGKYHMEPLRTQGKN